MKCSFARLGCSADAVVRVSVPNGCVCFPDETEQALCAQHWYKATPLGEMSVIEELE